MTRLCAWFASVSFLVALCWALQPVTAQETAPSPAPSPAPEAAGHYVIDPAHTTIGFGVGHLGISEVYGRFHEFEGDFTLGEQPRFEVVIQADSIDTAVEKRDNHLRTADFFNVAEYPTITFKSTDVEAEGDQYTITGDFTMLGQTHPVVLELDMGGPAEMQGQQRVGFVGQTVIDRRDWGMDSFQGMVGNDIRLIISFEGVKQPAQPLGE